MCSVIYNRLEGRLFDILMDSVSSEKTKHNDDWKKNSNRFVDSGIRSLLFVLKG